MPSCSRQQVVIGISYAVLLSLTCTAMAMTVLSLLAPKWDNYEYTPMQLQLHQFHQNLWGYYLKPKISNSIMKKSKLQEDYKDYVKQCLITAVGLGAMFILLVLLDIGMSSPLKDFKIRRGFYLAAMLCLPSASVYLILSGANKFKEKHMEYVIRNDADQSMKSYFSIDDSFVLDAGYKMSIMSAGLYGGVAALQLGIIAFVLLSEVLQRRRAKTPRLTKVESLQSDQKPKKKEVTQKQEKQKGQNTKARQKS